MRKNVFYLFMLLFSLSIFAGCRDDKNETPGEGSDIATAMAGIYKGLLGVKLDGDDLGSSTQYVYITKEENTKVKLELKDFSTSVAGTELKVGDIVIPNIPVEGSTTSATIIETATVINHPTLGQLDIKVTGTVADDQADLYITVHAVVLKKSIEITFSGIKTEDDTDYAAEVAAWYKRESLIITGDTVDSKNPIDGIEIVRKGFNYIEIKDFQLSFPSIAPNKTTSQLIHVDSVKLIKEGNGLLIDSVNVFIAARGGHESIQLVLSGNIQGENLTLNMRLVSTKGVKADYVYTGLKKLNEATLDKMTVAGDIVVVQPEIEQNTGMTKNVIFYVELTATPEQLKLIPTFEIADGATISLGGNEYVAGTPVDFSQEQTFRVKAQSGKKTITYKVKAERFAEFDFANGFEDWEMKNATTDSTNMHQMYEEPINGWRTCNEGVKNLKILEELYSQSAPYAVVPTHEGKSGKAARLVTLNTTGQMAFPGVPAIPVVTSGTVFSGVFVNMNISKFGYPCFKKPVSFQGSYKYTPGNTYLECKDPINADKVEAVTTKTDAPGINAVLYEVDSYGFDFLDRTNLLTSDKIVAKASLQDRSAKENYTDFNIAFDFGTKKFDSTKKYKLAIVCSSSIDGDKFTGAPGSVLYIDDLKVNFE